MGAESPAPRSGAFSRAWTRYWYPDSSLVTLATFRLVILFVALMPTLAGVRRVMNFAYASGDEPFARTWNPIYAFEVLGIGTPSPAVAWVATIVCLGAWLLAFLGWRTRTAFGVATVLMLYFWGLHYSYGQVHHEKIALSFAILVLPFSPCGARLSIDSLIARRRRARGGASPLEAPELSDAAAWPIRFTQVTIAIGYFFAGATKLWISGIEWANGYTLQAMMLGTGSPWSEQFAAGDPRFASLTSGVVLVVQLTFPLVLFFRPLRWVFVPIVCTFHLISWKTMGTGAYFTLWITVIAAFFALEAVPGFAWRTITTGSRFRRIAAAVIWLAVVWVAWKSCFTFYRVEVIAVLALAPLLALFVRARVKEPIAVAYEESPEGRATAASLAALDWTRRLRLQPAAGAGATGDTEALAIADDGSLPSGPDRNRVLGALPLGRPLAWLTR